MTWSQLRAFEACATFQSFNAAAASLRLTASAVRYQVGLLEARLGVRLYDRRGGRLALTATGSTFHKRIARPMQDLIMACEDASASVANAPVLLTTPPQFAREFLFDERFLGWCDTNRIRLDVTDAKRDLFGLDQIVAIRLGAEQTADLSITPILKVKLVLAAAPAIVKHARCADPAWWSKQNLLTPSVSEGVWSRFWSTLGLGSNIESRHRRFTSYSAALQAACAGQGILLAALPFVEREFDAGKLAQLSRASLPSPIGYSIVMRSDFGDSRRGQALKRRLLSVVRK